MTHPNKRSIHGDNASKSIEPPDGYTEKNFSFVYIYSRTCARYDAIKKTSASGPSFSPRSLCVIQRQTEIETVRKTGRNRDKDRQRQR